MNGIWNHWSSGHRIYLLLNLVGINFQFIFFHFCQSLTVWFHMTALFLLLPLTILSLSSFPTKEPASLVIKISLGSFQFTFSYVSLILLSPIQEFYSHLLIMLAHCLFLLDFTFRKAQISHYSFLGINLVSNSLD